MKLLVCGGGTGGHIYPAIAIAEYFKSMDSSTQIVYVGGKYGIENKIVPKYDYKFETIDIKGFQRKFSFENFKRVLKSVKSLVKMNFLLSKEKPDLVIGTGGYVCGPVVYMASVKGIKTAILEQNVFMGMTNKILSKKADHIFYGFEESLKRYDFKNAIVSGNPIRINEFNYDKSTARQKLGYDKKEKIILCVGGSGGSEELNNSVVGLAKYCKANKIRLIHVCGEYYYNQMKDLIDDIDYDKFELFAYLDDIGEYICSSDLVICSAGASTISEVTFFGKPMVVIPKAYTAENHQEYNAKMIENSGAGYYILDNMLTQSNLVEKVGDIILDEDKLSSMSQNSHSLSRTKACEIIYDTLINQN